MELLLKDLVCPYTQSALPLTRLVQNDGPRLRKDYVLPVCNSSMMVSMCCATDVFVCVVLCVLLLVTWRGSYPE